MVRGFRSAGARVGIHVITGGQLDLDQGVFEGGSSAIQSTDIGTTVNITNTLAWGTSGVAFDLAPVSGTVASTTIADSGTDTGTGPRAFSCSSSLNVRSTIVWAPGASARAPIGPCILASVIAGPTPVSGAMSVDPQFANSAAHDYHIVATSPARDAVDTGPP